MRYLRIVAPAALALGFCAFAQDAAPPQADLTIQAKLVVVPTVVRDKKGVLIKGLTKDDFILQADGKPQAIRYFDHDSDVPITVGLLVDTSMSQRSVLDDERTASAAFLQNMLAPNRDKAFLVNFAHSVDLLQDVTDSRPKLQAALKQLDAPRPSFQNGGNNSDHDRVSAGGTAMYDAIFLASDEVISKQQGRRALILLTDGDDRGSTVSLARSIAAAQHANTVVYAIYYKGEGGGGGYGGQHGPGGMGGGHGRGGFPLAPENDFAGNGQMGGGHGGYGQPRVDGKKVLEQICGETGGRLFEVSKKLTVDAIYTEIAEELRTQYRLGFSPSADAAAEGYHQITVTLTGAAAKNKPVLQTRDGYYTGPSK